MGPHEIEISGPGVEPRLFDVYVDPSHTVELRADLLRQHGIAFAAMGWSLFGLYDFAYQYVSTLAASFLLAGPFLCTGLYALSRDRERRIQELS